MSISGASETWTQAQREDVEAVEDDADGRVVGAAHDLPRVAVVADMPAPRQRLETDADARLGGEIAQLPQVGGGAVDAALGQRRDVRADQEALRAEPPGEVQLAPGAVEVPAPVRLGHPLEVAHGLERGDLHAEIPDLVGDLLGRAVRGDDVGLEELDALEARAGDGVELVAQEPAHRDGRYRGAHLVLP